MGREVTCDQNGPRCPKLGELQGPPRGHRTGLEGRREQGDGRTALEGIAETRISPEAR